MMTRAVFLILSFVLTVPAAFAQEEWTQLLQEADIRNVLQTSQGTLLVGAYRKGLFRSTDDGATFTKVYSLPVPEYFISFTATDAGVVYALGSADVFRSDDDGLTWTRCKAFGGKNGGCVHLTGDGHTLYLSSALGFYRNSDGNSWERLSNRCFWSLVARPGGLLIGQDSVTLDIIRSSDAGTSWTQVSHIEARWGRMLAGRDGYFYYSCNPSQRSSDAGEHWESMGGVPQQPGVEDLTVHPDGTVFRLAGNHYVYRSLDNGAQWTTVLNQPISIQRPGAFYVDRQWRVYITEEGRLLRTAPIPTGIETIPNPEGIVCGLAPNPSHGSAALTLRLIRPQTVAVSITDVLGRGIGGAITHELTAGSHLLPLSTEELRPGVYYITVAAQTFVKVQRLLLW